MIGNNVLEINRAEMVKAMEYYLNNVQFKEPVRVVYVTENKNDNTFTIEIAEIKENKDA
jgi:hypothetical protein